MKNLIIGYTRKQAIADGEQVLLNKATTEEAGYKYPVYMTGTVSRIIKVALRENKIFDYEGIIWDVLFMSRRVGKFVNESTRKFEVIINRKKYTLYIECGATDIDNALPCLTIMHELDR